MTIANRDQLINSMGNTSDAILIDKTSLFNTAAGQLFSLWTVTGRPGAGSTPTTAAVCTSALAGAIPFTNQTSPTTAYVTNLALASSNDVSTLEIHDRLAHVGGLSGTVTSSQGVLDLTVTTPSADRLGPSNYSEVQWCLEIYTQLGSTAVNATVAVIYNDATTEDLPVIALGATPRVGRIYPIVSNTPGKYIRAVNGMSLSATTGTAGNFGITATRGRANVSLFQGEKPEIFDWAQLGLPRIPNDSCLALITRTLDTTTGAYRGFGKIAYG